MEEKNVLRKIADGIVDYAPSVAKYLSATGVGVPAGLALGALSSLGKAFGLGTQATPDAIANAVATDPQTALKAMIAEQDFQLKQRELDIKELQTTLADVQSARQRETSVKDNVNKVLAYAVVGGFLALVAATLLGAAKVESVLAGTLVGYLSAKCEQVLAYYFGSSKSSDKKTDLLSKASAVKD